MSAPINETVTMDIVEDTVGLSRLGFGTSCLVSFRADFADLMRTYGSYADVAADSAFPAGSYERLAAAVFFGQSPKAKTLKIGRCPSKPTIIATIAVAAVRNSHAYKIGVTGDGVTATSISSTSDSDATAAEIHSALVTALNAVVGKNFVATFAALVLADDTFTAAGAVLTAVAHGLQTGDGPVRLTTTTTLPANLALATDYYVVRLSDDTFSLATSLANALAGTVITTGDAGTGVHTLSDVAGTVRPATGIVVTGDTAGEWFSLEINRDDLSLALTHADAGIATDLAALAIADSDFYAVLTPGPFASNAVVLATAAWAQANNRLYFPDIINSLTLTATVGGAGDDIADNLHTLAYTRTGPFYHRNPTACVAPGIASRFLNTPPGSAIVKFRRLTGIVPESTTATHRVNLRAKCCNWFEDSAGVNLIFDGRLSSGGGSGWIDVRRNLDYVQDDIQKRIFEGLIGAEVVGYDDDGFGVLEAKLRAGLENAVNLKIFRPGYTVEMPLASEQSDADKAARHVPGVKWSAALRGAVQSVDVDGTVTL